MTNLNILDQEVELKPKNELEIISNKKDKRPSYLKREAEKMFMLGIPYSKIATKLGISRQCVSVWASRYGWIIKRQKLEERQSQSIGKEVIEMNTRHVKISKIIQGNMIDAIQKGMIKPSVSDGLKAMEHEARIVSPEKFSTNINQNNLTISADDWLKMVNEAKEENEQVRSHKRVIQTKGDQAIN